jgi:endo-1,4-beta-xylanase
LTDFITRIMSRYGDDIPIWDVVNEPLADDGSLRESLWLEAMGEDYIELALRTARAQSADATLLINEFDISMAGRKFDALLALIDRLQASDVPLDGIGFQMHLFASYDQFEELRVNFAAVAARGLDIYITELDVAMDIGDTVLQQADVYRQVLSICLEQTACRAVQTWGFTDQYSFRSIYDPLPFDRAYQPKPAWQAMQEVLQQGQ